MRVMTSSNGIRASTFPSGSRFPVCARPALVRRVVAVDLPRPRGLAARTSPEFVRLADEITQEFLARGVLDVTRTRALIGT